MEREAERRHELELNRLELERDVSTLGSVKREPSSRSKLPKLPPFQDGKDELDSYCRDLSFLPNPTDGRGAVGPGIECIADREDI